MANRFNRPHLDISARAITRLYQAPKEAKGGGSAPRVRAEHGARLQAEITAAWHSADEHRTIDERLEPAKGVYLEVDLRKGDNPQLLEQKSKHIRPGATRTQQGERTTIALYVPDEARPVLEEIIEDYTSGPLTEKGQVPPHKARVEAIEAIRQSRLETFWTDDNDALPANPQGVIWWEVWCFKDMADKLVEAAGRLQARVADTDNRLYFPEIVVIPILTNRVTIELLLFASAGISELRRASATPTFFLETDRENQLGWTENLAERTQWPPTDAPAVCLLDTGVNRAHMLIEPALSATDATAVVAAWGAADSPEGHGTGMAGLALYGDLVAPLSDTREVELTHRLESVKVLPPDGFDPNDPRNYGAITQAATALAEIPNPARSRSFCMAITNDNVSGSRPTTWSAAIDQAAVGEMPGDDDDAPRRLFVVSSGNAPAHLQTTQILSADEYPIEDPAQAWNAITVGGYTDKIVIDDEGYEDWTPLSQAGGLSPFTRTSVTWPQSKTPFKPEIVMEAGNRAVSPSGNEVVSVDSLALLTTGSEVDQNPLQPFAATSAATAQAARLCAMLSAAHPSLWPETIRALIIHSAEWTEAMQSQLDEAGKQDSYVLLRRFGYGVPNFERAAASAANHLALIAQNTITPFRNQDGRKFKDCHFYRLPWPKEVLEGLNANVRLKVTLSYFVEPNPGISAVIDPQRYQSHGLRFDLRRRSETMNQFLERVNPLERENPHDKVTVIPDDGWRFGSRSVSAGSLHCDEWVGPAVRLAARDIICVKPVIGWWRTRGTLDDCRKQTRYALVATISAPGVDIDLHTPISTVIENATDIEISFGDDD
jgi:Subtilase family